MRETRPTINYDDFSKIDVRVGTIIVAERIEGSEKLLKLDVDFGEMGKRQILSGIAKWYTPEELVGLQTTFVVNLEPRKMMGMESQGMLFALGIEDGTKPVFLKPSETLENGEGAR